ncbi:MCE family protein [Actinocorallia sp. API 0066]|uniref:MCE family protein n=1 Tax=Actinocorallia sp. API 0066 TaxID=2896846 RepID=UPI001E3518BB|nr:MlaD family protein [Actinocorallia sp. API 0066]MCD0449313.1 MCE family protein [Actinocorallia sp. API 0066]
MNGRRVQANLAFFAVLTLALGGWAVGTVFPGLVSRPYTISAEFASAPGLRPEAEVSYLGVRIGRIREVRLETERHRVVVVLAIDRGVRVPARLRAAAARGSAVGEPHVELSPVPGAEGGPRMGQGGVIPIDRTSVPVSYRTVFGEAIDALKAIDPEATRTIVHELALGLEGRDQSLRDLVEGADRLTAAFATRSPELRQLITDLSALTRTLAAHKDDVAATVDGSAALLSSLTSVRDELAETARTGPGFAARLARLLARTRDTTPCAVAALDGLLADVAAPARLDGLSDLLLMADDVRALLSDIITIEGGGPTLNLAFIMETRKIAPLEHRHQRPQLQPGPVPSCPDGSFPGPRTPPAAAPVPAPGDGPVPEPNGTSVPHGTPTGQAARPPSDGSPSWPVHLPPALALLVLGGAAVRFVHVLRRRHDR